MRILTVTSSYPKFIGDSTAPFIASITKVLAARGHEITLVLPAHRDLDPEPIPGVRFCPFSYAPVKSLEVFGYAESLRGDVSVKLQTYLAAPLALISGAHKLLKEVRHTKYDVLHAHWVVPSGAIACPVSWKGDVPLLVSLHGSDVFLSEKKRIFREMARVSFRQACAVTACSDDLANRSLALGANERPIVLPYGVDTNLFSADDLSRLDRKGTLGIDKDTIMILAVGRLVHKKGFEYLIDAAVELKNKNLKFHIFIAGKGDLREPLESRARKQGVLELISFIGDVGRKVLPNYFSMSDIVVVPSVKDEFGNIDGLPNVLLEAMASGSAIVATEVAGIPQALRTGQDGLLVREKDVVALAHAIDSLARSPSRRQNLGSSARNRVKEKYNWNLVGERFESIFRSIA